MSEGDVIGQTGALSPATLPAFDAARPACEARTDIAITKLPLGVPTLVSFLFFRRIKLLEHAQSAYDELVDFHASDSRVADAQLANRQRTDGNNAECCGADRQRSNRFGSDGLSRCAANEALL